MILMMARFMIPFTARRREALAYAISCGGAMVTVDALLERGFIERRGAVYYSTTAGRQWARRMPSAGEALMGLSAS